MGYHEVLWLFLSAIAAARKKAKAKTQIAVFAPCLSRPADAVATYLTIMSVRDVVTSSASGEDKAGPLDGKSSHGSTRDSAPSLEKDVGQDDKRAAELTTHVAAASGPFAKLTKWLDAIGVEARGLDRVPEDDRNSVRALALLPRL